VSLHALAQGTPIADPQRRQGAKGPFATATLRVATGGGEAILVSIIAFGAEAEALLEFGKGDALAISGRAEMRRWQGGDGEERAGLSIVVDRIVTLKPRPKPRGDDASTPRSRQRSPYARHRPQPAADERAPLNDEIPL
jgi:single-stranded DNA-binding protein